MQELSLEVIVQHSSLFTPDSLSKSPCITLDPLTPSHLPPPLSLSRIHRLLRPLRTSLLSFTQSLDKHSNKLPPAPTTHKQSFYKSSRSSLDTLGDQDWATSKRRKLSSQSNRSNRPSLDQHSSSPFKQSSRRSRANLKSTKTYGSKRTLPPLAPSSSTSFPLSQSTAQSTWPPSFQVHERGIPKPELKDRLKLCFISQQPSNSQLDALVNKALHLFQTYSNVLDVVYTSNVRGRTGTASLQEISARQVGWEIEGRIQDWVNEGNELTMEEMERKLARELEGIEGEEENGDEDMSDEGSFLRDEMTRGEQDQACSDIQDEWYEACPVQSFRWILAEHATSILYNGFDQTSAPHALIETAFDLCLSYGASSEASRLQPLLISQAFTSPSSAAPSTSFLPLLIRSPSPLSLLTTLESHLLQSTFAEKLYYHSYLSITPSLLPSSTQQESLKRLLDYLSLMLGIGRVMGNHLITIYRGSEMEEEGLELKAFEKDSSEVFERCLKLIGNPPANSVGLVGRKGRKGKGTNRGRKGILGSLCELSQAGSKESEEMREVVRRLSGLAKEVEELVGIEESEEDEEMEEELLPTLAQQIGSISILFDLAHLSKHLSTTIVLPPATLCSTTLLAHLISTYLMPLTTPITLLSTYDAVRQRSPAMVEVQRAILSSVKEAMDSVGDDELQAEVDKRIESESKVRQESRLPSSSRSQIPKTQARSSPRLVRPPSPSSESEIQSSDSDVIIVSASPSPSVSPRRPRPRLSAPTLPAPSLPTHNSFTSEPDELLLLPPSTCREPPNRTNKRILLNPSLSPPASPSPSPSLSDHTSLSPSPPPPPLRSKANLGQKSNSRKRRSSSQGFSKPSVAPAFRSHVRYKSYDLTRRKGPIDEEEEDELMM